MTPAQAQRMPARAREATPPTSNALNFNRCTVENFGHFFQHFAIHIALAQSQTQRGAQVLRGARQLGRALSARAQLVHFETAQHALHGLVLFGELLAPFVGQHIALARVLRINDGDAAGLFEKGQRGVNRAGTGAVIVARELADRLDDFITVARLLLREQMQNQHPEIARVEQAFTPTTTATMAMPAVTATPTSPTVVTAFTTKTTFIAEIAPSTQAETLARIAGAR